MELAVALVGAGGMAKNYRAVWGKLSQTRWHLAVDVDPEQLDACRKLGVERTSDRFEDALADGIDVVDISTPNHLHEEQAIAALEAGKHVILQKPMANSLRAARNIAQAAKCCPGTLGMYMFSFARPAVWVVRDLLDRKALGDIQSIRARDAHRGGLRNAGKPQNWRVSRDQTGGGSFIQLSTHAINLMQWWLGAPIERIGGMCDNQYAQHLEGDDVAHMVCRFRSGVYGSFDSGWASDGSTREIYGTKGCLNLIEHDRTLELLLDEPIEVGPIRYDTPGKPMRFTLGEPALDDADNVYNPQRLFIEAVIAGKSPIMGADEGLRDMAVVSAAYRSASSGVLEVVDPQRDDL